MRAVDVNEALAAIGECPYNWNDDPAEIQAVADWRSVRRILCELPTIDVIPVAWLKKVRDDADDAGDLEMRDSISCLLEEWERAKENGRTKERGQDIRG